MQSMRRGLIGRSKGAREAFARWPTRRQDAAAGLLLLLLIHAIAAAAVLSFRQALSGADLRLAGALWLGLSLLAFALGSRLAHELLLRLKSLDELSRLARFSDASAEAVYGIDRDGICTFCNRACLRLLGYEEASQLLGSNIHGVVFDSVADSREGCPIVAAMAAGKSLHLAERAARRADGARISVESRSGLVHEGTAVVGAVVTLVDVGASKAARSALKRDREALEMQLHDLSKHTREVALFGELAEMLQAGSGTAELCKIVAAFAQELFPTGAGALYLLDAPGLILERRASWGDPPPPAGAAFGPDACWAIRRGKPHYRENHREDLYCAHVSMPMPAYTLCLPLAGQGRTLGLLHLRAGKTETLMPAPRQLTAVALAYQVALGLSNLKLKETLLDEAIRDPVTGLFNRRFMQESLGHEIQRAQRSRANVGVLAMDLDRFKEANDTLGHAAGDALLLGLAGLLKGGFRAEDIACRQGGDEFLMILPDISAPDALARAESLRAAFEALIRAQFPALAGTVTLSAGLAMFPTDAAEAEGLQKAADLALYRAKAQGRNRVEAAAGQ